MFRICIGIIGFSAFMLSGAFADGGESAPRFKDVRIGEGADTARVVVICASECSAERDADGSLYLTGVSGSLDIDLTRHNGFISALTIEDLDSGAFLHVSTAKTPSEILLAECDDSVICIDFVHPKTPAELRSIEPVTALPIPKKYVAPVAQKSESARPAAAAPQNVTNANTADSKISMVKTTKIPLTEKPVSKPVATTPENWSPAIAEILQSISLLPLSPEKCDKYQLALQNDAWDIDAYRMVALCSAAGGNIEQAETLLERMLALYPDDQVAGQALARLAALGTLQNTQTKVALRGGL